MSVVRIVLLVYVAYLAIALLVISPALNILPHRYLQDTYGRELRTGWVLFNPFKVSLDISEAELSDATGERFMAISDASIDLSMESVWQPGWVLDTVKIHGLYLEVTRQQDGEYNFSDLLPGDAADEPPADGGQIPGLTIHDLDVHAAAILLTDQARKTPYTSRWNELRIGASELSTVQEQGQPFSVGVEAEDGGKLQWEGEIAIARGQSAGHFSLSDLNLNRLWLFAEPWLAFELKQGHLAVAGEYQLNWKDALDYRISKGRIGLAGLDIAPKTPGELPDTAVALQAVNINGIALDNATHKVTIDTVLLDALAVSGWMEDATVSLQQLFAVTLPTESADDDPGESPWTVALNKAQLRNSSLRWRSVYTDPQVLDIKPVEASLEHFTWPLSGDSRLSLTLSANNQARVTAHGTLALAKGDGSIEYTLDGLPLTWFNPNFPQALKLTFTGGIVKLQGQVALQDYGPTTIGLNGRILDFSARREDAETMLTGFDLLRVEDLAVDMTQHRLVLEKLTLDSYTGRLHIREDGSINAANIWKREVGEEAQQLAEELTADKPWSFSIPTIQISDSTIDFMDQSLPIPFRTVIGDIEGEVRDISSDTGATATVELTGSVDGYAPVTLTGKVAPFATPVDLDLNLTFDGVDMALLSPYSRVYAGYAIEQGLLNLDLRYALQKNRLKGDNTIRIEKLKLGEKISSDKAIDIPLKMALAILTDARGVIDMAIPVTGDVKNPGFQLGSLISRAFVNIITKAVTAPFSLLANLVNTEENLQRLNFAAGSAQLNDTNKQKLTQLAAALAQRPKLSLQITGRLNLTTDRERLQRNALKAQLLAEGLSAEDIKARGPDWEDAIAELYEDLPASSPEVTATTAREQYAKVVQSIAIPAAQMSDLAEQRAVAVKSYLLNEAALAPDRAVVAQASADAPDNTFSGVALDMGVGMGN